MRGKYIVIEGHDGTGKSTQVEMIRKRLKNIGIESIEFHEPAGNPVADAIRNILKDGSIDRLPMTNFLLFTAARCDLWNNLALQALNEGKWVVASRSYYSSYAYQGYAEGVDINLIKEITKKAVGEDYAVPDYAFILSMSDEERIKRINQRGEKRLTPDNFESKPSDYQETVRLGYLKIAEDLNVPVISADASIDTITDEIWKYIKKKNML